MEKKRKAAALDRDGKCIVCGEVRARRTRGLCEKHYERFRRKRKLLEEGAALAWEAELVASGLLLENRQGQRVDADADLFSQAFDDFVARNADSTKEAIEREADEITANVEKKRTSKRVAPAKKRRTGND